MITFKEYLEEEHLLELFDKVLKYEHAPDIESEMRHHFHNHETYKYQKIGAVKVHKLEGDNGHLVHIIRNSHHELHHLDNAGMSGKDGPRKTLANPKFVGTMLHYAKEHILSKGRSLKISAIPKMHKPLKPIIERLAKKHNLTVTHGEETIGGNHTKYSIIDTPTQTNPLSEFMQNYLESKK